MYVVFIFLDELFFRKKLIIIYFFINKFGGKVKKKGLDNKKVKVR